MADDQRLLVVVIELSTGPAVLQHLVAKVFKHGLEIVPLVSAGGGVAQSLSSAFWCLDMQDISVCGQCNRKVVTHIAPSSGDWSGLGARKRRA